jgi:RES domain-containing protein
MDLRVLERPYFGLGAIDVMFDRNLYQIDCVNQDDENAALRNGAVLFRIASLAHWRKDEVLTGKGPMIAKTDGRFHIVDQRTTYCANNVMVCLSEVLFHMYRRVLDGIRNNHASAHLASLARMECRLVVLSVEEINDLVYIEAHGARAYDPRVVSSTIVFPDPLYGPLHDVSNKLRIDNKGGVVYPSARHSVDFAFALFRDETSKIRNTFYEAPILTLQLIAEDQEMSSAPRGFRPKRERLHATMGHYQFDDALDFTNLLARGLIHPEDLPAGGYIDFVRRRYNSYARDAFRA